jgi:molecular chaperone GrpE
MSRKKHKHQDSSPADDQPQSVNVEEPPADEEQSEPEKAPLTREQEIEKLRDDHLRIMAELRNVTQRAQREKQEALRYAEADFAKELLVVLDDLQRTLESINSGADATAISEGVRIVQEHFLKVLRGREIEPIEALGQPFDPDLHEALLQQPSDEYAAQTVMQELSRGYKMRDRVIRPTKVIVSSGPPE